MVALVSQSWGSCDEALDWLRVCTDALSLSLTLNQRETALRQVKMIARVRLEAKFGVSLDDGSDDPPSC